MPASSTRPASRDSASGGREPEKESTEEPREDGAQREKRISDFTYGLVIGFQAVACGALTGGGIYAATHGTNPWLVLLLVAVLLALNVALFVMMNRLRRPEGEASTSR